jgi:hypothetical protein
VNEVVVEDVVRSAQSASMNQQGRRLPVFSQLMLVRLSPALGEQQ